MQFVEINKLCFLEELILQLIKQNSMKIFAKTYSIARWKYSISKKAQLQMFKQYLPVRNKNKTNLIGWLYNAQIAETT